MRAHQPPVTPLVSLQHLVQLAKIPGVTVFLLLFLLTMGAASPSWAQETPRVQVFGGYSYTRYDTPSFGFSKADNLNGYNFAPAFNLVRGFGVVAELSGQYGQKVNLRDIAIGPQFLYSRGKLTFFGHLLFGEARSLVQVGVGEEDTDRAVVAGGGMDMDITPRFAFRVFQVDYLHTTLFSETQNNLRVSTGLVYRWGSIKKKRRELTPSP